eukprot:2424131-Pleurochrysis_carterae.AAC.1
MTLLTSKLAGGVCAEAVGELCSAADGVGQRAALCGGVLVDKRVGQHLSATATLKRAAMAATSNTCRPPIIK